MMAIVVSLVSSSVIACNTIGLQDVAVRHTMRCQFSVACPERFRAIVVCKIKGLILWIACHVVILQDNQIVIVVGHAGASQGNLNIQGFRAEASRNSAGTIRRQS